MWKVWNITWTGRNLSLRERCQKFQGIFDVNPKNVFSKSIVILNFHKFRPWFQFQRYWFVGKGRDLSCLRLKHLAFRLLEILIYMFSWFTWTGPDLSLREKPVVLPVLRIGFNIMWDVFKRILVPNNMIVKWSLPCK